MKFALHLTKKVGLGALTKTNFVRTILIYGEVVDWGQGYKIVLHYYLRPSKCNLLGDIEI